MPKNSRILLAKNFRGDAGTPVMATKLSLANKIIFPLMTMASMAGHK